MQQKVGILTFHCTDNPGSVLQAYALQRTIRSFGCECDIINYQKRGWQEPLLNGFSQSISRKLHIPYGISRTIAQHSIKKCYEKYDLFRSHYMTIVPDEPISQPEIIAKGGV